MKIFKNWKSDEKSQLSGKVLVLIFLLKCFSSVEAKEISCEIVVEAYFGEVDAVKTCFMQYSTSIDDLNVTFSFYDEMVEGLNFNHNKNISFLPVQVAKKLPNLLSYCALNCSIKEISKENFVNLTMLKTLDLSHNQIEKITTDTFEDLSDLVELLLGKENKLRNF